MELAPPPNEPANIYVKSEQITSSMLADTVATGLMVSIIESIAGTHGSGPSGSLVVIYSLTESAKRSAAEGV